MDECVIIKANDNDNMSFFPHVASLERNGTLYSKTMSLIREPHV